MNVFSRMVCWIVVLALGGHVQARETPAADPVPVTIEYYYRIKWGSAEEFSRLYDKNHAPLLEEMKKLGFIRSIRVQEPMTHMSGGTRWDMRVTIVFRDATAAISDPEWDKQWSAARERLYSDSKRFEAEETARFNLLEEHWDVIVNDLSP
jgi:hypothetical protein